MKTLVSIVVPVYNVRDYVLRCLESLVGQSYKDIEIVVVDDGSTDGSGEICDEFAKNNKRVRVFHKKNGGLSSARNYGIKKATGEYVCLVDSDDYVKRDFVKKMVDAVQTKKADLAICGYDDCTPQAKVISGKSATIELLTKQNNIEIIACNKLYKKELFKHINYPEGEEYEDNLTTYKILSKAKKVVYLSDVLYVYVERKGSITKKGDKEKKLLAREKAAIEATNYFGKEGLLRDAAQISLLTAELAFMDFAINDQIDKSFFSKGKRWVQDNASKLRGNRFLTRKLRLYLFLIKRFEGKIYIGFRKIIHE